MVSLMPDQKGLRLDYANKRRRKIFATTNRVVWKTRSKFIAQLFIVSKRFNTLTIHLYTETVYLGERLSSSTMLHSIQQKIGSTVKPTTSLIVFLHLGHSIIQFFFKYIVTHRYTGYCLRIVFRDSFITFIGEIPDKIIFIK